MPGAGERAKPLALVGAGHRLVCEPERGPDQAGERPRTGEEGGQLERESPSPRSHRPTQGKQARLVGATHQAGGPQGVHLADRVHHQPRASVPEHRQIAPPQVGGIAALNAHRVSAAQQRPEAAPRPSEPRGGARRSGCEQRSEVGGRAAQGASS